MKEITNAQEEILNVLWDIKEGVVSDVVNQLPDPKPAYNTVSTVIKVLERKGYLSHKVYGKTYVYFPVITKADYTKHKLKGTFEGFFKGSLCNVVSFFANENDQISIKELEELRRYIDTEIRKQNKA